MGEYDGVDQLASGADALNDTLASTNSLVTGFDSELRRMRTSLVATGKDVSTLERGLSRGLRKAFDGVVFDGMKLSDALKTVAQSLSNSAYNAAVKPVTDHFGGLITQGITGLVQGALPFGQTARVPQSLGGSATGGPDKVGRATAASMGQAAGATVVMNITTPDAQSFQRSQAQIAAQMSRALSSGNRNS